MKIGPDQAFTIDGSVPLLPISMAVPPARPRRPRIFRFGACSEWAGDLATIGVAKTCRVSVRNRRQRLRPESRARGSEIHLLAATGLGSTLRSASTPVTPITSGYDRERAAAPTAVVADRGDEQEPARRHRAHEAGQRQARRADEADVNDGNPLACHPVELDREQRQ